MLMFGHWRKAAALLIFYSKRIVFSAQVIAASAVQKALDSVEYDVLETPDFDKVVERIQAHDASFQDLTESLYRMRVHNEEIQHELACLREENHELKKALHDRVKLDQRPQRLLPSLRQYKTYN